MPLGCFKYKWDCIYESTQQRIWHIVCSQPMLISSPFLPPSHKHALLSNKIVYNNVTVQLLAILCPLAFAVSQPKSCPLTRSYRALLLLMNFGGLTGNSALVCFSRCAALFLGPEDARLKYTWGLAYLC